VSSWQLMIRVSTAWHAGCCTVGCVWKSNYSFVFRHTAIHVGCVSASQAGRT
jgi:hypothetical protein